MKNILAAIMLMGATVSVDAMNASNIVEAAQQCAASNAREIARLSWWQKSKLREYQALENDMIHDVANINRLARADLTDHNIINQIYAIYEHCEGIYHHCMRCIDALRNAPRSFGERVLSFFGWRSKMPSVVEAITRGLATIRNSINNLCNPILFQRTVEHIEGNDQTLQSLEQECKAQESNTENVGGSDDVRRTFEQFQDITERLASRYSTLNVNLISDEDLQNLLDSY